MTVVIDIFPYLKIILLIAIMCFFLWGLKKIDDGLEERERDICDFISGANQKMKTEKNELNLIIFAVLGLVVVVFLCYMVIKLTINYPENIDCLNCNPNILGSNIPLQLIGIVSLIIVFGLFLLSVRLITMTRGEEKK
jgi:heme/copper-type cytochrome/quinol oxidase subunit 2